MSIAEYTALGVLIVAIIGLVWRVSYMLNRKVSYESFDRHKKESYACFVTKDTCEILRHHIETDSTNIKSDIKEIKNDVKTLLGRHE